MRAVEANIKIQNIVLLETSEKSNYSDKSIAVKVQKIIVIEVRNS